MSATATHAAAGRPVELGRYRTPTEERVLVGRRIEGVVHVADWPRHGAGRRYHVEAGFRCKTELAALVADYRREAERLGACPMSRPGVERAMGMAPQRPVAAPVAG